MREAKNTQRALVRIGYDGTVHKTFRGPNKELRFKNEVRVLKYLESRKCPFVPRLLNSDPEKLEIVTSNCGSIVQHITEEKANEIFQELHQYGVRHDDPFPRNITYRPSDGRFCVIDFEFAEILDKDVKPVAAEPAHRSAAQNVAWSGCTHQGRFRPNNEDKFLAMLLDSRGIRYLGKTGQSTLEGQDFIFAVSDGMGGARSGEFASSIAIEKITQLLPKQFALTDERFTAYSDDILGELFRSIHKAMLDLGRHDPNCLDMGATLTLTWFRRGRVYYGHIGDTRLYHLPAAGGMQQITEDHSHVGWLRRSGKLNERETRTHPRKNVLTQALGAGHRYLRPEVGILDYEPGDRFLLCSDGVIEGLWDHRLEELVLAPEDPHRLKSKGEQLVLTAVAESGRDNATAIIVETS